MPEFEHVVIGDQSMPKGDFEIFKEFEEITVLSTPPNISVFNKVMFPINILNGLIRLKRKKSIYKKIKPDLNIIHGLVLFGKLEKLYFVYGVDLIKDKFFQDIEPKILTLHNLYSPLFSKNQNRYMNYENNLFKQFETYICIDKNIYNYLKKKYPSKEIHFVPNSIPDYFFTDKTSEKRFNPKVPVIGYVGRYEYSRGIHILKRFVEKSPKNFKYILVFSANQKMKRRILREFSSNKNIELCFNLPNDELPKYYRRMDFLFNPVLAQGISRVSLEAMALGVLPIMIDIGDRFPIRNNETGILFNEQNIEEIVDKIKNFSKNEYQNIRKKAQQITKENFSNSNLIPQLRNIYKKHIR
jgi:glycosyltransferase involved in cell wall biosynthesis